MINEMTEQMMKATLADHQEVTKEMLAAVRIQHSDPVRAAIYYKAPAYVLLRDLHMKLLVAPPATEFVASDTPVISHNQLMQFRSHLGSVAGIGWKGLQMFYPISPRLLIMLYDPNVYVVGNRRDQWHFLTEKRDVDELNVLQAANSYENFYFNSGGSDFMRIADRAGPLRRSTKSRAYIGPKEHRTHGFSRLVGITARDVRMDVQLTFVRLTKPAKAYQTEARKQTSNIPAVVMRSRDVERLHVEYSDERRAARETVFSQEGRT